jgi:hypothetical protein
MSSRASSTLINHCRSTLAELGLDHETELLLPQHLAGSEHALGGPPVDPPSPTTQATKASLPLRWSRVLSLGSSIFVWPLLVLFWSMLLGG